MLHDDVLRVLGDLRHVLRAKLVEITPDPSAHSGLAAHCRPLGGDEYLRVELGDHTPTDVSVAEQLERTARHLRTLMRLAEATQLPLLRVGAGASHLVSPLAKITELLQALRATVRAEKAWVTVQTRVVATTAPLAPAEELRLPFTLRQARSQRPAGSSHGEWQDVDVFVLEFHYDAALWLWFAGPYGVDMVRHRARAASRQLGPLLAALSPEPPSTVAVKPRAP